MLTIQALTEEKSAINRGNRSRGENLAWCQPSGWLVHHVTSDAVGHNITWQCRRQDCVRCADTCWWSSSKQIFRTFIKPVKNYFAKLNVHIVILTENGCSVCLRVCIEMKSFAFNLYFWSLYPGGVQLWSFDFKVRHFLGCQSKSEVSGYRLGVHLCCEEEREDSSFSAGINKDLFATGKWRDAHTRLNAKVDSFYLW